MPAIRDAFELVYAGVRSGWRRGSAFDRTSMIGSLILYSMPEFWLGMLLLLLFSSTLGWFPVGGRISVNASELSGFGYVIDVANHLFLRYSRSRSPTSAVSTS